MYNKNLIQSIAQKFNYTFIDSINFIEYDSNWAKLHQRLSKIKKSVWNPNEKILVQHSDTEFFFNGVGLSIYNFNQVIKSVDIDPAVFVILTNHKNSSAEWRRYCNHEKNQFHVVETPLTELITYNGPLVPLHTKCQTHFGTMLGLMRGHRSLLAKFLIGNNLVEQNLVSINLKPAAKESEQFKKHTDNKNLPIFITTDPNLRNNEYWTYNQIITDLYNSVTDVPVISNNRMSRYDSSYWLACPWYEDMFLDLVTETVFNYPYPFISEKVMRPIVIGRPFLLFGAPGTLEWLHDLGFQTFDQYWSEQYDNIIDPNDRFIELCNIIKSINNYSITECQNMLTSMQAILAHNQQHYRNWTVNCLY